MPRRIYSDTLAAAVRKHFGLTQAELARLLDVTPAYVAHLEAGRRRATRATNVRLDYLALLLPPPTGTGPEPPTFVAPAWPTEVPVLPNTLPAVGPLDAGELRQRLLQVRAQAARLRLLLHQAGKTSVWQQRREWALAVLQAALPTAASEAAEQEQLAYWLGILAADVRAGRPSPAARTELTLSAVRILALEAEAALLSQLLEPAA